MRPSRVGLILIVAFLLLLSLLPIPNWIINERTAPWYGGVARAWLIGTTVLIVVSAVLAQLRGTAPLAERIGAVAGRFDPRSTKVLLGVGILSFLVYLATSLFIFGGRPLLIDEVVQLLQARMYAAGQLWATPPSDPAFRSIFHMVEHDGRVFGHFPPGWPMLLAIGEALHLVRAVPAVVGALTVVGFGRLLRQVDDSAAIRGAALLLFAFAPFHLFLASSTMNHEAALMWAVWSLALWSEFARSEGDRSRWLPIGAGILAGMSLITRPAEGSVLVGCLAVATLLLRGPTLKTRVTALIAAGLAAAVPVAFMLAVNAATTGSAFTSGYELLWGPNVGPGFHEAPWGPAHTPTRGFELIALYLLRLNTFLFDGPFPALALPLVAIAFASRFSRLDRLLLGFSALILVVYFGYWHDGFYLGPRFMLPLMPALALWAARFPTSLGSTFGAPAKAGATLFVVLGVGFAVASGMPERAGRYRTGLKEMRWDVDSAAAASGVSNALVFVRETWGSQLVARLWALGITRPGAERYYHAIDACLLERTLGELEASAPPPDSARATLDRLTADSAKLVPSPLSPDTTERALPGSVYVRRCIDRIRDDRAGTSLLPLALLARGSDVEYVRSLPTRNAALAARRPDRRLFVMTQNPETGAPIFQPMPRDSLMASH